MSSQEEQVMTQEITITPEAASEIKKIRVANNIPDSHALRVGIKSSGCCGSSYLLAFDDKAEESDKIFEVEGVKVFVDSHSLVQLAGTTLGYINGAHGSGFKFDNPNDAKSCGCGEGSHDEGNCGCGDGSQGEGGCGCGGH